FPSRGLICACFPPHFPQKLLAPPRSPSQRFSVRKRILHQLKERTPIWKSKEMVHNRRAKDRPIGLPARCASIPCSKQTLQLARLAQALRLSRVLALRGTRIRW